jgi:hypothetical protein
LRPNRTITDNNNYDLYNTISFSVKEESVVEFYVNHNKLGDSLQVSIDGQSHYAEYTSAILKPGAYQASIKVENSKNNVHLTNGVKTEEIFNIDSLEHLIQLYIGISPTKRVTDIYAYNNILSTYHQCKSPQLPNALSYDSVSKSFTYKAEMFTFNREELKNLKLGSMSVVLKKSSGYRIIAELGGDYVLNKLNLVVKSENKKWETSWVGNRGDLDITVPQGTYQFELELDEKIIPPNFECIIFSIKIIIVDTSFINTYDTDHPLYYDHKFDS